MSHFRELEPDGCVTADRGLGQACCPNGPTASRWPIRPHLARGPCRRDDGGLRISWQIWSESPETAGQKFRNPHKVSLRLVAWRNRRPRSASRPLCARTTKQRAPAVLFISSHRRGWPKRPLITDTGSALKTRFRCPFLPSRRGGRENRTSMYNARTFSSRSRTLDVRPSLSEETTRRLRLGCSTVPRDGTLCKADLQNY